MNNPNHHMNPSSRLQPCSPASFPHHHIHHLCPHHYHHHHHHHHHHGCHHHHSYSHLHHHHFNCHAHVFHSNLAPPPPLQNPEPETSYPSQKVSNLGATANIHTQTSSSAIQVFHQPGEEQEEEGLLEQEEEEEDDDDDPVFVLTDEWREFFARSEAKRQLEKKQRAKERRETSGNSFSSV